MPNGLNSTILLAGCLTTSGETGDGKPLGSDNRLSRPLGSLWQSLRRLEAAEDLRFKGVEKSMAAERASSFLFKDVKGVETSAAAEDPPLVEGVEKSPPSVGATRRRRRKKRKGLAVERVSRLVEGVGALAAEGAPPGGDEGPPPGEGAGWRRESSP